MAEYNITWSLASAETNKDVTTPQTVHWVEWYKEWQVIIPEVNTTAQVKVAPWDAIETMTWAPVSAPPSETTTSYIDSLKGSITDANKDIADRTTEMANRDAEDKANLEKQTASAISEQAKKDAIVKESDTKLAQLETEQKALVIKQEAEQLKILKAQKAISEKKIEQEAALQKSKDDKALRAADKANRVALLQSSVAYNKLWLTFSSWAINTSQQIARDWILAIADLQIQASYNQAQIAYKWEELALEYTSKMNDVINSSTDKQIAVDKDTANRIYNTQNSLLLSEKEKNAEITRITENYRNEKRDRADNLFNEIKAAKNDILNKAKEIEWELRAEEERNKAKIEDKLTSWEWSSMSIEEKEKMANAAWTSVTEIDKKMDNAIQTTAYSKAKAIMWNDFMFTKEENILVKEYVDNLVNSWVWLEEAIDRAVNNVVRNNPEYDKIKKLKDAEYNKSLKTAKSTWAWSWTSKIGTSDMKQGSDWKWYAWTWTTWVDTWLWWKTTPKFVTDSDWSLNVIEDWVMRKIMDEGNLEINTWAVPYKPTKSIFNIKSYTPAYWVTWTKEYSSWVKDWWIDMSLFE
mgnify:CR=1 FL=1